MVSDLPATVIVNTAPAERRGHGPSRNQLFAALVVVALGNAFIDNALLALAGENLGAALGAGLGVSWGLWLAAGAAVGLALNASSGKASRVDWIIGAVALVLCLAPDGHLAALAASGLGAWMIFSARGDQRLRAAGAVLLAITVSILWTRIGLLFVGHPLQVFDSWLAALAGGTTAVGNTIQFADGDGAAIMLEGCMSLQNAGMAVTVWLAVTRLFRPQFRATDILWAAGVFCMVFALNIIRLGLIVQSREAHRLLHDSWPASLYPPLILLAALGVAVVTIRREILD